MRLGVWALAALMIGAFGAHFLLQDRGYVLINFRSFVIEMSVPILILLLAVLYAVVRLALRIWRAPRQLGEAIATHRHRRAADKLTRGLIHMTERDWVRSERLLTDGLKGSESPLVNYLMAARAAHSQGARERRNEWLSLAYETLPKAETTILLTQAELQFEDGDFEHALATIQRILDKNAAQPAALAQLAEIHIALDERDKLVDLLPRLAKAKVPADKLSAIAVDALSALVDRPKLDAAALKATWDALPGSVRKLGAVKRMQALALDKLGKGDEAVKELTAAIKRDFDPTLIRAYGEVKAADPLKQLKRAENWLKQYPEDAVLLLTVARLCIANELWGKARSYLESSLAIAPEPAAYALYGSLLDRLGEGEQAAQAYHSGLSLVGGIDIERPVLEAPPKELVDAAE